MNNRTLQSWSSLLVEGPAKYIIVGRTKYAHIFIMAVLFQSTLLNKLSANNLQHEDHLDARHDDSDGRLLGQLLLQPLPLGGAQHVR